MRLHRFIVDNNLQSGLLVIDDEQLLYQLKDVLRLKSGDEIILADGRGKEALVKISGYKGKGVEVEIAGVSDNKNEPDIIVNLYCSILKRDNFELIVQKVTEIGVKNIIPIISKRTVKLDFKRERLEKIIKEAAEQSGRGIIPKLAEPIKFSDAVSLASKETNILLDISGEPSAFKPTKDSRALSCWIGPEGGWDEEEVNFAKENGFRILSLGLLTLRAETAAIVASYLSVHKMF